MSEDDLDDHVIQWNLVLRSDLRQLHGTVLSLHVIRVNDARDFVFDQVPFDGVRTGKDELLGHVGVVEHAKDDLRQRIDHRGDVLGNGDLRQFVHDRGGDVAEEACRRRCSTDGRFAIRPIRPGSSV